jgi:hypothetical protein
MTVEHNLNIEGGVSTHLDGEVPPLPVNDVKVVMVYVRPWRFSLQVECIVFVLLDIPHQPGRLCDKNEKKTGKFRGSRDMLFGNFVFSRTRCAVDDGNALSLSVCMNAATEASRHSFEMSIIQ